LLAKTTPIDQSVDLPLWPKPHNRFTTGTITSCDTTVAIGRQSKESQNGWSLSGCHFPNAVFWQGCLFLS